MDLDILVRGGTVIDGLVGAPRQADVGVRDGRIVAVEPELASRVDPAQIGEVVDATGRIVTPGFVDVHTHYDGQATWDGLLEPSTDHGVTTVLMGNCGVGFAPVHPADHDSLIELMEGVEDIPGAALAEGITWGWESFPEYLDVLAARRWSVDVGTQLAHGPLRRYVMGPTAAGHDAASPDELATMGRLVREAVEAGAFGFTTSRTLGHKALDGTPVPGTYAGYDELATIAASVAASNGRLMEFAAAGLARSDTAADTEANFAWMGRLAVETGLTITFILQQCQADPERWRDELHQAARWRAAGTPVIPLVAGRPFGVLYGWEVRHPFMARPTYRRLAALPLADRLVRLADPDVRAAILSEDDEPSSAVEAGLLKFIRTVLGQCQVMSGVPDYEQPRSQSIAALAELGGTTREAVAYDGLLTEGAMLIYALYNYVGWDHAVVLEQLEDPDAVLGLADGGAHVNFICDASIPTYMLTHWARDRTRGPRLPLADVVRRLTSQPADLYGLTDRGRLAIGLRADLNVIDHTHLSLAMPTVARDLPAGGTRLLQPASGYDLTMVAGTVTRRRGVDTGARPGRLVRAS